MQGQNSGERESIRRDRSQYLNRDSHGRLAWRRLSGLKSVYLLGADAAATKLRTLEEWRRYLLVQV